MEVYRAHGITIASEIPLALSPGNGAAPDLVLRLGGGRPVPADPPTGELLAEVREDGSLRYVLARGRDRTVLRYPGLCDFAGNRGFDQVHAHLQPGLDPGLLSVLAAGGLLAVHLMLRHRLVLHASAVETAGRAIAFIGASGMGKSTLATALCGVGCVLVTDDVLRADIGETAVLVHPGSTQTRLRQNARTLADEVPDVRSTADGRLAVRLPVTTDRPLPLAACVVPLPSRTASRVSVRRLAGARALLRMSQFPRVLGWREPASADRAFQSLADLVERVPVYEATIPWGPPFPRATLDELLGEIGQR